MSKKQKCVNGQVGEKKKYVCSQCLREQIIDRYNMCCVACTEPIPFDKVWNRRECENCDRLRGKNKALFGELCNCIDYLNRAAVILDRNKMDVIAHQCWAAEKDARATLAKHAATGGEGGDGGEINNTDPEEVWIIYESICVNGVFYGRDPTMVSIHLSSEEAQGCCVEDGFVSSHNAPNWTLANTKGRDVYFRRIEKFLIGKKAAAGGEGGEE